MADDLVTIVLEADPVVLEVVEDAEPIVLELVEPGMQGPPGSSPPASRYEAIPVAPAAGVLTIDLAAGSHFLVDMNQAVTTVVFQGAPPADQAQGVFLYLKQDGTGGRTIASSAWPAGRVAPGGVAPILSTAAGALDIVVINAALAAFGIVAVTLVARDYRSF